RDPAAGAGAAGLPAAQLLPPSLPDGALGLRARAAGAALRSLCPAAGADVALVPPLGRRGRARARGVRRTGGDDRPLRRAGARTPGRRAARAAAARAALGISPM